jgi:hypothetical protein
MAGATLNISYLVTGVQKKNAVKHSREKNISPLFKKGIGHYAAP